MMTEWKRVSTGAKVRICTDCAALPGTKEYDRRVEAQCRAAYAILVAAAKAKQQTDPRA